MSLDALRDRFFSLGAELQVPQDHTGRIFEKILSGYSEPHRRYHTLEHVAAMLGRADALGVATNELEMAIWFHDIVYDPRAVTNEQKSAEFFEREMGAFLEETYLERVVALILATQHGGTLPESEVAEVLCDLDLEILSAKPDQYCQYRDAIREEYRHVPAVDYAKGRAGFLREMLRHRIYRTPYFEKREGDARRNLEQEIAFLSGE